MQHRLSILGLVAAIVVSVLLPACTSNLGQTGSAASTDQYSVETTDRADANAAQASPSAAILASAAANAAEYRISSRDILDISVFQVPDLNKSVQVSEDGSISLPLIGKVPVGGKTTQQAEELIAERLRKSYLQSPQVAVSLKQYGQRVTVNGEVKNPRVLTIDGKVTLAEAIASAGGLSELANPERIHIARMKGQSVQDEIYNLDAIQAGRAPDPALKGGDIVVAEQSGSRVALKNVKDLLPFAIFANLL